MADDEHVSRVVEKLVQGFAEKSHLHAALHGLHLAPAAVENISAALFDDGLIAAATERKLHRLTRALVRAGDAIRSADGNRERDQHAGTRVDSVRLLQQRKPRALHLRQMLRFKYHEEAPVLIAAIHAVDFLHKLGDQTLHLGEHARPMKLHIRGKLFVVVDIDQRDIRHLLFEEPLIMRSLRAIQPVLKQHRTLVLLAVHGHAHHLIDIARELQRNRDERRRKIKVRLHAADIRLGIDLLHALVAPGNRSVPLDQRAGNCNLIDQLR